MTFVTVKNAKIGILALAGGEKIIFVQKIIHMLFFSSDMFDKLFLILNGVDSLCSFGFY